MEFTPLGDKALLIDLGGGVDAETLARVRAAMSLIDAAALPGVTDVVAGYSSVTVHYEPVIARRVVVERAVKAALECDVPGVDGERARTVEIPVRYGGESGPDLDALATQHGMSAAEIVALHVAPTYTVHMIGFLPGFPYLGGLDPRLATPRRETPRTSVPAGSVGIGGAQTGVYPLRSPGGWHLIGRTDLALFDAGRAEPSLLHIGDRVRFVAVGG